MRTLVSVVRVIARLNIAFLILASMSLFLVPRPILAAEAQGSLYELTSVWTDQHGKKFNWKDLQGRVALVGMVYTSCQQTCPLIISEISALQKALPEDLQDRIVVLLFTMDPQRDTPEHLAAYAKERKLNPSWRMLHGSADDVQELAAVLGFRYKKMESGDFAHSNIFTVLDQKGQMRHQQLELFSGRPQTVDVMKSLLKQK